MKTNRRKVYVEWVDSGRNNDWNVFDEVNFEIDFKPVECESVGWLIVDDPDYIVIAQNIGYEPDQFCGSISIPRCAITKITDMLRECDLTD